MAYEMSVDPNAQNWIPDWAQEPQMSVDPAYENSVDWTFSQPNQTSYEGGQSSLSSSPLDISGWSSAPSESSEIKVEEPEQPSFLSSAWTSLQDMFKVTYDKDGRAQQSFGAAVITSAANEVLKMMAANRASEQSMNLENQKSSNKIREKSEEESRLRAAASAMPAQPSRGTRSVGLLSQAR